METKKSSSVNFILNRIKSNNNLKLNKSFIDENKNSTSDLLSLSSSSIGLNNKKILNLSKNQKNYVFKSDEINSENADNKNESIDENNTRGIPKYLTSIASTSYENCINFQISRVHEQLIAYPLISSNCVRSDLDNEFSINEDNQNMINSDSNFAKFISPNQENNEAIFNVKQVEELNLTSESNNLEKLNENNTSNCFIEYSSIKSKNISSQLEILKPILVNAINEIIIYKPDDPIEFLANYLHNFNSKCRRFEK